MANSYPNATVLSKVQINGVTYYLKDLDARAILDSYKNAVNYNVNATFDATREELATEKAIAAYINQEVAGLAGAMHFKGSFDSLDAIDFAPVAGDIVIIGTKEYVYGGDPAKWNELGDEGTHASKAYVDDNFVKKTITVAGIDLADAITVEELQNALALKALAYKDSASATLADYATGINAVEYTPAGSVTVALTQTSTPVASSGTYTPVGAIKNGTTTAAGSVSIAASEDANAFQVTGTVAAPNVTVTPITTQIQHIASVGTLPKYTESTYVAPSVTETSSQFATAGLVAALDKEDTEMLVFSDAGKSAALTGTGFNAGSYTKATYIEGSLPEFGNAQTIVTGIEKAEATAPAFVGGKIAASFAGAASAVTADFEGTEKAVNVSGNYDKAGVDTANTKFDGTKADIQPTLTVGTKVITVQ